MSEQKVSARASAPKQNEALAAAAAEAMRRATMPQQPATQEHPFAYAIIEGPPGQWSAVCLEGVTAREVQRLEPNGDPEPIARAMMRVTRAVELRTIAKKWSKP